MSMNRVSKKTRDALENQETTVLEDLIKGGEDVNGLFDTSLYLTSLAWASEQGITVLVQLLVNYGANLEASDLEGNTPLILAAMEGHLEVVEVLLNAGADLNQRTRSGWTALDWARKRNHWGIVELLKTKI